MSHQHQLISSTVAYGIKRNTLLHHIPCIHNIILQYDMILDFAVKKHCMSLKQFDIVDINYIIFTILLDHVIYIIYIISCLL